MNWTLSKYAVKNILHIQGDTLIKRYQTHYEVLNLSRNCNAKEIRNSFIKLSKTYHPDKNNDKSSKAKFIKIVAAYDVLSKPDLRRDYDLGLVANVKDEPHNVYTTVKKDPWSDPLFWKNRQKEHKYTYKPYYGIDGVGKISNFMIVLMCLCVATIGVGLQILAIRKSMTLKRDEMLIRSAIAEEALKGVKEKASVNGNLQQLEALKKRMGLHDTD